jgi:hypothetical protein
MSASLFGKMSHQFPLVFTSGNFLTLIFEILTDVGVINVLQFAPVNPCGQLQPQFAFGVPPFKQGIGVQAGVELSESDEQLTFSINTTNKAISFFIIL